MEDIISNKKQLNSSFISESSEAISDRTNPLNNSKRKEKVNISILHKESIDLFKKRTKYELMYEAFYISNLFYEMQNTPNHLKDPYFYIINSEWLIKWKKYVNFDFYTNENGWKHFIKLNMLQFRIDNKLSQNDNYLNHIKENTKKKIYNYFDSYFLSNNEKNYPGRINNKILIIFRNRADTYININQVQSNFNYNLLDEMLYKKDYIWVTEDIWKYFYCIYGGFEIRRHNLNESNNIPKINKEIIFEAKLKTINLIIFHFNKNYNYKIDPPKKFYISHLSTIRQMKEKIKEFCVFLKSFHINDIRLWVLDEFFNENSFYKYIWDNRLHQKEIKFPGINLDIFDDTVKVYSLEEKILKSKNLLVLELPFLMPYKNCYFFSKPIFNNFTEELKTMCININNNNAKEDCNKKCYDHLQIYYNCNNNFIINLNLFLIKKFFWNKYILEKIRQYHINELNILLDKIIQNFTDEQILTMFNQEIEELKKNMDLIFDKNFLAKNIDDLYLNEFEDTDKNDYKDNDNNRNYYHEEKKEIKLINNKRLREKNNKINLKEKDTDINTLNNCGYCKNKLEKNSYILCSFCLNKKYCSNICRNNDIREHLKQCGI